MAEGTEVREVGKALALAREQVVLAEDFARVTGWGSDVAEGALELHAVVGTVREQVQVQIVCAVGKQGTQGERGITARTRRKDHVDGASVRLGGHQASLCAAARACSSAEVTCCARICNAGWRKIRSWSLSIS